MVELSFKLTLRWCPDSRVVWGIVGWRCLQHILEFARFPRPGVGDFIRGLWESCQRLNGSNRFLHRRFPLHLQYRHLIPALVDRISAGAWLYKHPLTSWKKIIKPSKAMTHVACEAKLRSVARSSMHPRSRNRVAIGRAFVYYAQVARAFSAEITFLHSICTPSLLPYYVEC